MNLNENIIIDDNNEIITINNPDIDSNIPMEFFNKNLNQDELIKNYEEENKSLRKELTLIQEKFSIIQTLSQHQSKLIELLFRLDLIKSTYDDPGKREEEDLQRKIELCSNLIEECNINFRELCNHKRRVLLNNETVTPKGEKRAAIWEYFTIRTDRDGQKTAECNFCGSNFIYKTMNANKCREHIHEKCEKAPDLVKTNSKPKYESQNKSKFSVWNYFMNAEKDGKSIIICAFCNIEYSSRNATKCREHLAFKCTKIPEEEQLQMRSTFSPEHIDSLNINKRSSIWEHFNIFDEDDKPVIQCIYCCLNYANKNATKCREHLLERCEKIPLNIRHQINHSFYETPTKTWTQIKIPIWKHFSVVSLKDRKQFRCNYCKKDYASKNVTKFRLHLLCKCNEIPDEIKEYINGEVTKSIKQNYNEDSLEYMEYEDQMMNEDSDNNENDNSLSLENETGSKSYILEPEEKDNSIETTEKYSLRKKVKLEILDES